MRLTFNVRKGTIESTKESEGTTMKSTGIVRHIDNLGRITLPIELRKTLDMAWRFIPRATPSFCVSMSPAAFSAAAIKRSPCIKTSASATTADGSWPCNISMIPGRDAARVSPFFVYGGVSWGNLCGKPPCDASSSHFCCLQFVSENVE